jgi:hypothetical protein
MRSYLDTLDAKAEAEAQALQWVRDNLNVDPDPVPAIRKAREAIHAATVRGIAPVPYARYARLKATRQWVEYLDALKQGAPARAYRPYLETREDRQRQRQRREHKRALLAALEAQTESVSIARACELTDSGRRTIERALTRGELSRERNGTEVAIPIPDLRQYLARRVAPLA